MFKIIIFVIGIYGFAGAFQPRISGGFKTLIEQFPHQVSIPASCFIKEAISDLTVAAGSDSLEAPQQVLPVAKTRIHEMFTDSFNRDCNVGLLELHGSLLFSPSTQPIPLQHHQASTSTAALIAGWGVIVGTGSISHELRAAGLRILPHEDCVNTFEGKGFSTDRMMCGAVHVVIPMAKNEEAVGPCSGDEGAGLICTDEMALCGIAWTWNYACGVETPDRAISGYTKINHPDIINWLKRYV
ncbi:trypsin-2-like [Condylostylus longicornis]|uniref:trypsin-2-like n=1 Tax=Condylostylus longicornis TaxID=2530218 RepID=UPI00244DCDD8|nr:trypsin-2-like [Condylostylus longicornis]